MNRQYQGGGGSGSGGTNQSAVSGASSSFISSPMSTGTENGGGCFGNQGSNNQHTNVCVAFRIWFTPDQERTKRELRSLSKNERENVWADLSANEKLSKYEINPEEPIFVKECLTKLRQELGSHVGINTSQSAAYQKAISQDSLYVLNDKMLLRFLRADCFDTHQACTRILKHYEMKSELFGDDVLGRDITYQDLSDDDRHVLSLGHFQMLNSPDHAQRNIFFFNIVTLLRSLKYDSMCTPASVYRPVWYFAMIHTQNEDVQKRGLINVNHIDNHYANHHPAGNPAGAASGGGGSMIDYEFMRYGLKMPHCMPHRYVATYIVLNTDIGAASRSVGDGNYSRAGGCDDSSSMNNSHSHTYDHQHHPTLWDNLIDFMYLVASPFLRVRTRSIRGKNISLRVS